MGKRRETMSKEHDPKQWFTPDGSQASSGTDDFDTVRRSASEGSDFFFTGGFRLPAATDIPAHTPAPRFSELTPGTLLRERYEIEECLGLGGTGRVYRAFDRLRERALCLKVLHEPLSDVTRQQLQQEIWIQERLHHDGIARTYDLDVDRPTRRIFFSMELIEGPSLAERLRSAYNEQRSSALPLSELRLFLQHLTDVLAYVHQKGFVHCDLKPSNLLLPHEGGVKILDFGMAIEQGSTVEFPRGTAVFMAPEQLRRQARPTAATDVYAVGVMLYQMLTGEWFYGHMPGASELLESKQQPVTFPRAVDQVLFQAVHALPERRFQSMPEFFEAFEQALEEPEGDDAVHLHQFPVAWMPMSDDDEELSCSDTAVEIGLASSEVRLQHARLKRKEWDELCGVLRWRRQMTLLPIWGYSHELFSPQPRLIHHCYTPRFVKARDKVPDTGIQIKPNVRVSMLASLLAFCLGCFPAGLAGVWFGLKAQQAIEQGELETAWTLHQVSFGIGFVGSGLMVMLFSLPFWRGMGTLLHYGLLPTF